VNTRKKKYRYRAGVLGGVLAMHFTLAPDSLFAVETVANDVLAIAAEDYSEFDISDEYPTLTKATFGVWYVVRQSGAQRGHGFASGTASRRRERAPCALGARALSRYALSLSRSPLTLALALTHTLTLSALSTLYLPSPSHHHHSRISRYPRTGTSNASARSSTRGAPSSSRSS
jgi:hypothetical protein